MEFILTITLLVIVFSLLAIVYALIYNQFQNYNIKINNVEKDIDNALRNKFDILSRSIKLIKNNVKGETDVLKDLSSLKDEKISNYEVDRKLIALSNELITLKDKYPDLNNNESFNKIINDLDEIEQQLTAYKKYYNDNIAKFNRLTRIFPSNLISSISRFKEKLFYDGKDMNDGDTEDFKL